ncbi:MAG: hypothetical protein ALECFALPRED_009051 [Alectoria fallacina]|uniref:Uncharacterized protein n=1 Tax=Alectoria fallacina TaxID=1903189 RepID=A0A8H3J5U3_9LECA|nr:MAG: hypothetical protein ALECFALPRED_009051 [Alectoria fallacina]
MPGSKRPRVTKATTSSSGNEDDDVGAAENDSPTVQRQKRRSIRQHRSGPGDNFSVPGKCYPSLPSARRPAPTPRGQLPTLPNIFTRPAAAPPPTAKPEQDWLDPQLPSGPAIQSTVKAAASSSDTSKRLGTKEVEN